ncbi:MAG: hypothetical protein LBR80_17295 [Deltaproteobacteria bacterium]|jgi:chromosome segregation ATPase|nr:hypothetical protein [Deltaproteobacteria bacterium]
MAALFDPDRPLPPRAHHRSLDPKALMALARDIGRLLSAVRPIDGYDPEPPAPEIALSPKLARALAAPSLAEWFGAALKSEGRPQERSEYRGALPRGPESIDSALAAVRDTLEGWRAAEEGAPGRYGRVKGALMGMEAALLKAQKLLPGFSEMCAGFSQDAHGKYLKALSFRDQVEGVLRPAGARGDGGEVGRAPSVADAPGGGFEGDGEGQEAGGQDGIPDAPALTAYTASLRECLAEAEGVRKARERWLAELETHRREIENCAAALGRERAGAAPVRGVRARGFREDPGAGRGVPRAPRDDAYAAAGGLETLDDLDDPDPDEAGGPLPEDDGYGLSGFGDSGVSRWAAAARSLSEKAQAFERRHEELARGALAAERKLKGALNALTAAERRMSGERSIAFRDGTEALGTSVEALLGSVLARRAELAGFWRLSPSLVGRPAFLEKIFLSAAVNLGLAQGLLEETRHLLDAVTRRLSATRKIRRGAEEFLAARDGGREAQERLWQADRALNVLKSAVAGLAEGERLKSDAARLSAEGARLRDRLSETEAGLGRAEEERLLAEEELARSEAAREKAHLELGRAEEDRERARRELGRSREELGRSREELGKSREDLIRAVEGRERAERACDLERQEGQKAREEHERELERERGAAAGLRETAAGLREAGERLGEKLAAVEAERGRLAADLQEAQRRLAESGEAKARLVKLVERAREALKAQGLERKAVQEELLGVKRTLDPLRRKHRRLSELFGEGRRRLKALEAELKTKAEEALSAAGEIKEYKEGELAQLEEERARHLERLQELTGEIAKAETERGALAARQTALTDELEEMKGRETALSLKLAGKEEELREASRTRVQLGELIGQAQVHLDRVTRAHNALKGSWRRRGAMLARANLERDDLRLRLDRRSGELVDGAARLQEAKAELGEAAARRAELEREREGLLDSIEEARRKAAESSENEERLARELEALKQSAAEGAEGDLAPVVEILGIALWRSGLELGDSQRRHEAAMEERRIDSGAREAGLRVELAARELDRMELSDRNARELEEARAEVLRLASELASRPEAPPTAGPAAVAGADAAGDDAAGAPEAVAVGAGVAGVDAVVAASGADAGEGPLEPLEITVVEAEEGASPDADMMWLTRQLAAAFLTAETRRRRDKDRFAEFVRRGEARRSEDESARGELRGLLAERDRALEENRERVNQLVPLVEFFLREGGFLWRGDGIVRDAKEALVFFLLEENRRLAEEVEELAAERQEAAASRRALTALTESMKKRLATLRPLLEFLAAAFQENTLALARAYALRDKLARDAASLREEGAARDGAEESAGGGLSEELAGELGELRTEGARLALENRQLSSTAQRQSAELAVLKAEAARLREEGERAASELAVQSGRAEVASKALEELRNDPPPDGRVETAWAALNYLGARAGDAVSRLETQLTGQAREIEEAFAELQRRGERIKDLERRQDRISLMYWTMLSLATRGMTLGLPGGQGASGGGEGGAGGQDDGQGGAGGAGGAGGLGGLGGNESGDTGSGGVSGGGQGSGGAQASSAGAFPSGGLFGSFGAVIPLLKALSGVAHGDGPIDREGGAAAPAADGADGGLPASGQGAAGQGAGASTLLPDGRRPSASVAGGILSKSFLRSLKEAAKKSLFSLVLTGGMAAAAAGQADAEEWRLPDEVPAGLDSLRRQGFSPFHGARGGAASPQPAYRAEAGGSISVIATKMRSATLGRTLDLGFLSPLERDVPEREAEEAARAVLGRQAAAAGLDLEGWVGLVREAVPEGATVYLADLEGPGSGPMLLAPRLPRIAGALKEAGDEIPDNVWGLALLGCASLKPGEGQFWERLFGDFSDYAGDPAEAAMGAVFHLFRKNRVALPVVEFVGEMSPVKELEDMPHRRAVEFLSAHLRSGWNAAGTGRRAPREAPARRLFSDLYHASRIFRIPLTFLFSTSLADWSRGGPWPGTAQVYSRALSVAGLVSRSARLWDPDSPRICDLDEISPVVAAVRSPSGLRRERDALARSAAAAELAYRESETR